MTTAELLLTMSRCVRSAVQMHVDTRADPHNSSAHESGTFPGKQVPLKPSVLGKMERKLLC